MRPVVFHHSHGGGGFAALHLLTGPEGGRRRSIINRFFFALVVVSVNIVVLVNERQRNKIRVGGCLRRCHSSIPTQLISLPLSKWSSYIGGVVGLDWRRLHCNCISWKLSWLPKCLSEVYRED